MLKARYGGIDNLPFRKATSLALPMMLANISTPLMGIADTAMLGRLEHASFLGGVAVGINILTLLFWTCSFLRMSMTAAVGRAYGDVNLQKAADYLIQSIFIALVLAILLVAMHPYYLPFVVNLISQTSEVNQSAMIYSEIRIWSAPWVLLTFVLMGWLMGAQSMLAIVVITLVMNGLNIVLDYYFILVLQWGVKGAAWATVISEISAFIAALIFVFLSLKPALKNQIITVYNLKKYIFLLRFTQLLPLFKTNGHLFVRTLLLLLVFNFFTAQGGTFGDEIIAANAILLQILFVGVFAVDGYAYAGETMIARVIGKKKINELHNICLCILIIGAVISSIFTLILFLGQQFIIHSMTSIATVNIAANHYYNWLLIMPLASVACYMFDGIFIGAGQTKALKQAIIISVLGVFLPVWLVSLPLYNHGLWLALLLFHIGRGVTLIIFYKKITKNLLWFT